jgi:Uma2 family endonuclease
MSAETAFRSEECFDQRQFRRWLDARPADDLHHYELLNGRIVMSPPAGWPHGSIGGRIVTSMSRHVREHELGHVLDSSAGYDLPSGDTVEPDISYISRQRFESGPKPRKGQFVRIVPDLVVEILSPSTTRRDRTEKKKIYEDNGVDEYWIVDPDREEVTIFRRGKRGYGPARPIKKGRLRSRVLPGLELTVADIFA